MKPKESQKLRVKRRPKQVEVKAKTREEYAADVEDFLQSGGRITVCPTTFERDVNKLASNFTRWF